MSSRRVLLVVENVPLARDHRLRKQVTALHSAGYRVSVICRRDAANEVPVGVRLFDYRAPADATSALGFVREYGYSWVMAAWLTARAFMAGGFDAIQISGTPDIYFTIGAPLRLFGKRVLLDQRDLSPELYEVRYRRRGAVYWLLRALESLSYRTVDHVITVNGSLERLIRERGGLPDGAVTVVGNGPSLAHTDPRQPQPSLRNGRGHLCCWLGLMGPQDQVALALRAVAHLVHDLGRTDCHFAFIGDGECRAAAERESEALRLTEFVSFPGWLGEDAAFTYLCTAELGLEPNLEDIVSPVKGMEYMAFGLPFVAFDLSETRALAGEAAAYAAPGDVRGFANLIAELLDDPRRRLAMGNAGKHRVQGTIAWEHQERAYLETYRRLLGGDVRPAEAMTGDPAATAATVNR
jgi:glycosyltransferase involved in cell wall biosynthesis